MVMSKVSGEQIPLFESGLTDHAPCRDMFQHLRIGQQGLHRVFLHRLTKGLEKAIQQVIMWLILGLHGTMVSLQMTTESMRGHIGLRAMWTLEKSLITKLFNATPLGMLGSMHGKLTIYDTIVGSSKSKATKVTW